jgi:gamma-resorcylate decarboxylase
VLDGRKGREMYGRIAFEEHIALPETLGQLKPFAGDSGQWDDFARRILDLGDERLREMDSNSIELAILSLNSPGVQGILDTQEAISVARKANDRMAEAVSRHPTRFAAFAALPMQDPDAASAELTRCVSEMGFKGAMLNGFTQKDHPESAIYYDVPEYRSFWATVSELNVPVYLHPRMQLKSRAQNYEGHPWLMSAPWGFAVETSIHALRLCGSGIFDEYRNLRIVLGHLGENIPYGLDRMDERMRFSPRGYRGKKLLGEYFREHFHLTVSGNFSDAPFRCALEIMGEDRLYFSTDYPFETMTDATEWFTQTTVIGDASKQKIGRDNAIDLFNLVEEVSFERSE